MHLKKKDLPNTNDLVICTVKNILHHSVFVSLDEYDNLEGLIHISEIAPGRIRNIRDYVKQEKKIVCKVLNVNEVNRHVDLSLRRVSITSMKNKFEEYRQEEKAEKLLEYSGKQINLDLDNMYKEAGLKIIENFGSLQEGFSKIAFGEEDFLKKAGVNENIRNILIKIIKEKIKPLKIKVNIILELKSYEYNGIELIKTVLTKLCNNYKKNGLDINIFYISAPKYQLEIITTEKKNSEIIAEKIATEIINESRKLNIIGQWQRKS